VVLVLFDAIAVQQIELFYRSLPIA